MVFLNFFLLVKNQNGSYLCLMQKQIDCIIMLKKKDFVVEIVYNAIYLEKCIAVLLQRLNSITLN